MNPHNHRVVWGCWTIKEWWDEGNPNPETQRLKCLLSMRRERYLPKPKYIFLYHLPKHPSIYEIYLRETGYGEINCSTVLTKPLLDWIRCSVQLSNRQTIKQSIHWEIQSRRHRIWVGCPLPQIPGLRGKRYTASTRVDEQYNDIEVGFCTKYSMDSMNHATLHDEFEGDGWHDEG